MTSSPGGAASHVLYVDHRGHPAPLLSSYHATAARGLSSEVRRRPPSTVTAVDSAHCPQCLAFRDAATAARHGFLCTGSTCPRRCPLCLSVAPVRAAAAASDGDGGGGDGQCFYQCGLCDWTSKECDLFVTVASSSSEEEEGKEIIGRVELARAAEDLAGELDRRRGLQSEPADAYFKSVTDEWDRRSKESKQKQVLKPSRSNREERGGWSVETLEESLRAKKLQWTRDRSDDVLPSASGFEIKRVSADDAAPSSGGPGGAESFQVPVICHALQSLNSPRQPVRRGDLLPLPVPLRVRESRRCRAELAEGRPGILLKPKLNPVEGDTSLRTGHGQWHKKDSSAVHVVPRVRVTGQAAVGNTRFLLLKVSNPTLGSVRLRFAASSYRGEVNCWSDCDDDDDDDAAGTINLLQGLLVDTLSQEHLDVELNTSLLSSMESTDKVELLSSEDSILELGVKAGEVPHEVASWSPREEGETAASSAMQVVATRASTAWFQLAVPNVASVDGTLAVPIALQVDIGNGSWESSLIQPQEGVEDDHVTFDLVIVLA